MSTWRCAFERADQSRVRTSQPSFSRVRAIEPVPENKSKALLGLGWNGKGAIICVRSDTGGVESPTCATCAG